MKSRQCAESEIRCISGLALGEFRIRKHTSNSLKASVVLDLKFPNTAAIELCPETLCLKTLCHELQPSVKQRLQMLMQPADAGIVPTPRFTPRAIAALMRRQPDSDPERETNGTPLSEHSRNRRQHTGRSRQQPRASGGRSLRQ